MAKFDEFDIKVVNTAATELAESIAGKAIDLIPLIQATYNLEGHLVNLVLARAWGRCAVAATSQVARISVEQCAQRADARHTMRLLLKVGVIFLVTTPACAAPTITER